MNLNTVILIGRLTKDVEIKVTQNNKKYANCTLAVNRDKEKADFISVLFWEKTAELLRTYCHKGSKINVVGRLQTRTYDDPNIPNKKVYVTEVVANQIEFLDNKSSTTDAVETSSNSKAEYMSVTDDELPF